MKQPKHTHSWFYPHSVWEGRRPNETAVVRYCCCGTKQMAFASNWGAIPKEYVDARKECIARKTP